MPPIFILIRSLLPLFRGRILHFRGQFDALGQREGAKSYYLSCRLPDAVIDDILNDETIQRQLGLDKLRSSDRKARFRLVKESKQAASYWMGLVAYESGDYEVAQDYFAKRTLQASPLGFWTPGARYNLGRTLEMLGDTASARQFYELDDSPQHKGHLLRANFLNNREKTTRKKGSRSTCGWRA